MVTGRRAFQAGSSVETMNAILKEEPPEVTKTNASVSGGARSDRPALPGEEPDERFQSARDLAFQIEALSTQSATATLAQSAVTSARPFRARPMLAAVFMLLAFLAGSSPKEWPMRLPSR